MKTNTRKSLKWAGIALLPASNAMKRLIKATKAVTVAALLAGSLAVLSGCGGGGATYQAASSQTLGKELQDLQESYDKGIITKKQYEDSKKQLIKKYTR
jgi:hypothetical protein